MNLTLLEEIKLTFAEFEKIFSLHDSSIEKIEYDVENKKLNLEIDCCHWFENFDDKKIFINRKIFATFENVSYYFYEDYDLSKLFSDYFTKKLLDGVKKFFKSKEVQEKYPEVILTNKQFKSFVQRVDENICSL